MEEAVYALGDEAFSILAQVRLWQRAVETIEYVQSCREADKLPVCSSLLLRVPCKLLIGLGVNYLD